MSKIREEAEELIEVIDGESYHDGSVPEGYKQAKRALLLEKAYQAKCEECEMHKKMQWAFATSHYSETQRWGEKVNSAHDKAAELYKQAENL
jgi:hypothetical protein